MEPAGGRVLPVGFYFYTGGLHMTKEVKLAKKEVEETLTKKSIVKAVTPSKFYLSTGCTLLNLACTGRPNDGFPSGKYTYIVGDTRSGKTFLCMTCLAEATIDSDFDDYHLILDNVEDGCNFDIEGLFNKKLADRLEPPAWDGDKPSYSRTIQEFYYNMHNLLEKGEPFVYVLDSMDGLTTDESTEHFDDMKDAHEQGKAAGGSYLTEKARINSEYLNNVVRKLPETNSILIIVSQTRANLGMGAKKKRSGGNALPFYATVEMWSKVKQTLTKTVKKKKRRIGVLSEVTVKKNRINGKTDTVEVPIYPTHGFDDVGSCVDYLENEKWWSKEKNSLVATEFDKKGTKPAIIKYIEENNLEPQLREIVGQCWHEIAEACAIERKSKY